MSTYNQITKHPITGVYENAQWIDDYFDHHVYGVKFSDGKVYPTEQVNRHQIYDFWKDDVIAAFREFLGSTDIEEDDIVFLNLIQKAYKERWARDPETGEGAVL